MDTYSSGEEVVTKTRKPYTITKQRERWTEEEHTRFLDALKLYGRAWQRIEEHIGTKTAVQIRSHAQKFFTKMEKEALVRGLPIGQAIDIEIPPPRPKRKPSNPYPRKTSVGTLTSQVGTKDGNHLISDFSLPSATHLLDLEKEATPKKQSGIKQLAIVKKNQNGGDCADAFSFSQEALSAPLCSENKSTVSKKSSHCNFKEFVPILKKAVNQEATNESYLTFEASGDQNNKGRDTKQLAGDLLPSDSAKSGNYHSSHDKLLQKQKVTELKPPANFSILSSNDMHAAVNYPRHVPVHIVNGSLGMSTQTVTSDFSVDESLFHQTGGVDGNTNIYGNVAPAITTEHQSNVSGSSFHHFPTFNSPLTPVPIPQSDCHSFLHLPSTFTSLVASALLKNPAAHAAASVAARFWPVPNIEPSADPLAGKLEDSCSRMTSSAPSLEALAAATVTAATAWWASQGLLPFCTPFNASYTCSPAPMIATTMENSEARVSNNKRENPPDLALKDQQLDPKCSEALAEQQLAVKSPPLSSSESVEDESEKLNTKLNIVGPERAEAVTKAQNSEKTKDQKLVDRSSCGSNTTSSSDVETDALEKHDKEEANDPDLSFLASDSTNRRGRVCSSLNESWKEVSKGGRQAFRALFSREVLPQSFASHDCHQKYSIENDKQSTYKGENERSQFDLNSKACGTCSSHVDHNVSLTSGNDEGEGMLTMGLEYLKFKARRTGFKPYKRCSVEAKESRATCTTNQEDAKAPKRMRLEGGASP